MPGWIIPRTLKDGSTVFDIGYRVGGKAVRKKGGRNRAEAETALIIGAARPTSCAVSRRWRRKCRPSTGPVRDHRLDHPSVPRGTLRHDRPQAGCMPVRPPH